MLVHTRSAVLLSSAIILLSAAPTSGKSIEDRKWLEVRTDNFQVRGDLREKELIELARYLETFRVAVSVITNVSSTESPIPTEIYAMSGKGFKSLGMDRHLGGQFMSNQRSNIMLIRDARGMRETTTILHEYVHFLVHNHGRLYYPMWFNEGFAEYLSEVRMDRETIKFGGVARQRYQNLAALRWVHIRKILSPEDYDDWSRERKAMFYAESWALVHYLHNQPDATNMVGQQMEQYIQAVESGKKDIEAFELAFGMQVDKLDRQLKNYLDRGKYREIHMSVDALVPDFDPDVVKLSREQVSLALGRISLRRGELDKAEYWYSIAATSDSTRAQAEAGLGDVMKFRGEFESARPYFESAVALAPDDPYCQLDLAEYWHTLANASEDEAKRAEYIANARAHYVKAWKLDDSMPETYAQYGQTYLLVGNQYDRAIEMLEEAEYLLPSDIQIRMALTAAYAAVGRTEDAAELARSVLAWSYDDEELADQLAELLAALEPEEDGDTEVEDTDFDPVQ